MPRRIPVASRLAAAALLFKGVPVARILATSVHVIYVNIPPLCLWSNASGVDSYSGSVAEMVRPIRKFSPKEDPGKAFLNNRGLRSLGFLRIEVSFAR